MSCENCEIHYEKTYIRVGNANIKIQGCKKHLAQLIAIHRSQSDLLAACERYIAYRKGADDSIDNIAPQIEAAIAEAKTT